jgi:NAD(P)-dependent dehydrogenase (short-subunit alcohol dehydrogenase family)
VLDALLDRSIFWSFDASGFERHARRFVPGELDVDLHGKTVIVTGANSGLGFATARALAMRGAEVWMACRDAVRGAQAAERIAAEAPVAPRLALLDVSDLAAVRAFASHWLASPQGTPGAAAPARVHALIHNAGLLNDRRVTTPGGLEQTFGVHVAGPHLLTRLLGPRCDRVIWVASGGMYSQRLDVARTLHPPEPFDGVTAYARCKRAQVVLSERWASELAPHGTVVHAMHPGWAATPGVQRSLPTFDRLLHGRLRSAEQGADTIVWLAAAERPARTSGRFYFDRAEVPTHLLPWTRETDAERRRLWEAVEAAVAGP